MSCPMAIVLEEYNEYMEKVREIVLLCGLSRKENIGRMKINWLEKTDRRFTIQS